MPDYAGLEPTVGAVGAGLNEPETMAERTRQAQALEAQGMPPADAARMTGTEHLRQAYERRQARRAERETADEFGYGDLARYGIQRAAEGTVRGGARAAEEWLDLPPNLEEAAEAAAIAVGPSEEQERAATEFTEDSGTLGKARDAMVMEAPAFLAPILTGAATGAAVGSVVPGAGTATGVLVGGLLGAATGIARQFDEGVQNLDDYNREQIAAERGIAPEEVSDEEVRARFSADDRNRATAASLVGLTNALPAGRVIAKLPLGDRVLRRAADRVIDKRSVLVGAGKEAVKVGMLEGAQEIGEELALDVLTNKQLHAQIRELPEQDIRTVAEFLYQAKGEDYAVSFLSAMGLGGGAGATSGAAETAAENKVAESRAQKLLGMARARGVTDVAEVEERLNEDPERKRMLPTIAATLDRHQAYLDQAEALLREATASGASEDTIRSLTELRDKRAAELDTVGDGMGKALGIKGWKSAADVRRQAKDNDSQRRQDALDRLKARGEKVSVPDLDAETAMTVADRIDNAEAAFETAEARHQAIANPERKAKAREELDKARQDRHEARVEAAQKLRGRTHAQAVREVDKLDRLDRQREAREEAIAKQLETELPETMDPTARAERAQEIVDQFERNPMEGTKGLQSKIKRLERQRRAATNPETIDRLNSEIADLEARRGLSPPAVEAARRVLQAQGGPVAQAGLEEASPEAGEVAEAEGQPEAEAAPAGEAEAEVAPEPASEPAGQPLEKLLPKITHDEVREDIIWDALNIAEGRALPFRRKAFAEQLELAGQPKPQTDAEIDARAAEIVDAAPPDILEIGRSTLEEDADEGFEIPRGGSQASAEMTSDTREGSLREKFAARAQGHPWVSLRKDFAGLRGFDVVEAAMAEWTEATGLEIAAHMTPEGEIIAIGTNNLPDAVMPPKKGLGDPDVIFTHTHPKGHSFSSRDIRAMMTDGGQIFRAVMPNGSAIEMRPLRGITEQEFNQIEDDVFEHLVGMQEATGGGIAEFNKAFTEAVVHALDAAEIIDYSPSPEPTLDELDMEVVHETISALLEGPIADLRNAGNGRPHPAETRPEWGPGSHPRAEAEEDVEGDEDDDEDVFEAGGMVSSRRRGRDRPSANPERIAELARDVIERSKARKGGERGTFDRAVRDGVITEEQVADALAQAFQGIGNKRHYVVHFMAQKLFPDTQFGDKRTLSREYDKPDRDTKKRKRIYTYSKENLQKIHSALFLINDIRHSGHGAFERVENEVVNARGRTFTNFFHIASPELAEWAGYTVPAQSMLFPPLDDPNDTSEIIRDPSKNLFVSDPDALAPMERTARHLQRNAYDIDETKLAALIPNDLISSKSLGELGLVKSDLARHDRLYAENPAAYLKRQSHVRPKDMSDERWLEVLNRDRPPGISDVDWTFMRDFGPRLREMQQTAAFKLQHLRDAYRLFRETYGPDAKIGHVWQIDNRGRIYADGEFHPQSSSAIKGLFVHEGRNIVDDMTTVDASASGWQVTALMARDEELAPRVNLGRGQATEPGYTKRNLYKSTTEIMRELLAEDAAANSDASPTDRNNAAILYDLWPNLPTGKDMVKKPIIAMNYGGGFRTFSRAFSKLFGPHLKNVKGLDRPYGYLARVALRALDRQAPRATRLQNWSINSLTKLVQALEAKYGPGFTPEMHMRVGLDGRVQTWKNATVNVKFTATSKNRPNYLRDKDGNYIRDENGNRVEAKKPKEDYATHSRLKLKTPDVAAEATARSLWSNLVQGFDASILHRTVERYKQATNGAFITTNHDAMTVPREHEGVIASAYRESMKEIMGRVDVPRRLYDDIMAQARLHGVEVDVEPFLDYGSYNLDDMDSATPVFGEDAIKGQDYVPDYAELPRRGAELRREGTENRQFPQDAGTREQEPEAVADRAPAGETPVAAAEGGRPPPAGEPPPASANVRAERASAVDVAGYMEQYEGANRALTYMQEAAAGQPGTFLERSVRTLDRNFLNAFQPIRTLERRMRGDGTIGQGMDSVFKAAEMARNDSGRNEALLYYGAGSFGEYGEFRPAEGTVGLREIFRTASGGEQNGQKLQHFFEYMAARRARELNAEGIKTPQTPEEIETALGRADDDMRRAEEMWHAHNRANLKMLLDSGRISQAQHDAMAEDPVYVPFYRTDQRLDGSPPELELPAFRRTAGGELRMRDPGIHAMRGGDKMRIANLAENMIRNSQTMVAAAMRNAAANKVFNLMDQAGLAEFAPGSAKKPHKDAIKRWVDGKEEWVIPRDDDAVLIIGALGGLQPIQLDGVAKVLNWVSNIFRMATTSKPSFIMNNLWRGVLANGILTQGANLTTAGNTVTGIAKSLGIMNPQAYRDFKAISGMGDFRLGQAPVGFGQNDILVDFGLQKADIGYQMRKIYNAWENVSMASEMADRVAVYDTMIANGVRPDEAAYQALNVMNYSRRGGNETLRHWLSTMPFLNARLQGYARLFEGTVGKNATPETRRQAGLRMALTGLSYTAATAAAWTWNNEDEERRDIYQGLPSWRRTMFFNVVMPNGFVLTLPQPFELGFVFSAIPAAVMDEFAATISAVTGIGEDVEDLEGASIEVTAKVVGDIVAFDFIPQAVGPILEGKANYDMFFGRGIETMAERDLPAELRDTNADEFARFVGTDAGLSRLTGISPAMLSHWGSNFGGVPYTFMAGLFNTFAADVKLAPPEASNLFGSGPPARFAKSTLRGFVFDPSMSRERFAEEYYQAGQQLTEAMRGFRRTGNPRYLGDNPDAVANAYRNYNRINSEISDIKKAEFQIREDKTMSPDEKRRRLQRLTKARNTLYERATEAMNQVLQ